MSNQTKLTENQTVEILIEYLKKDNWNIDSFCKSHEKGLDIVASRDDNTVVVEVKGAKADEGSPLRKRDYFDAGQIKTHFGRAIVKMMEERVKTLKPFLQLLIPMMRTS